MGWRWDEVGKGMGMGMDEKWDGAENNGEERKGNERKGKGDRK